MADTRGTWSLSEAWAEKTASEWVGLPSVWLTPKAQRTDTCYWVAGVQNNTPTSNTVDKTNIPGNTTAQVPGLNNVMPGHWKGGHSSGTAGYSAGGRDPQQSKIGKITYATDAGEILSSYLTAARGYVPIGFCNDTFGWFLGGGEPGTPWPVAVSKVDKMTFATEAVALLPGTQLHSNLNNTTTSGNTTKGYYAGGQGPTSKIAKIEYSSDTNTLIPSTIPIAMYRGAGTTNGDGTIGYYIGGSVTPGMSYTSNCTKHVYATDTISDVANGRQYNPRGINAGSGNQTYALSAGGYYYPPGADYSSIDRMTYSNETSSRQPGLDMSTSRRRQGAHGARTYGRGETYDADKTRWTDDASQSPNTSYILYGGTLANDTFKLNLSTETGADTPSAQLPSARRGLAGTGNKTQGYFSSGYNSGSTPYVVSNTDKLTYSNDTCARLPGSNIPGINGLQYHTAISSETNGYFWAGLKEYPTVYTWTKIYKITYSTDAMSTNPSNMTGSGNYRGGSTNSATAGYESGGATLNDNAIKYTFSTETAGALPGFLSDVSQPRAYCIATGNQTAGYWAGGSNYSRVAKVTWATETAEWTPGNLENGGLQRMNATSNTEKGYWIGGYPTPSGKTSVTTFATDTHARNPSVESLSPAFTSGNDLIRASVGARQSGIPVSIPPTETPTATSGSWQYQINPGIPNHGYYMGGNGPDDFGNTNSMKMNFATDTLTTGVQLSQKYESGGQGSGGKTASSPSHAYVVQGKAPSNTGNSYVRKIQYSNDTASDAPTTPSSTSWGSAIAGSTTNLYKAGGHDHANVPLQTRTGILKLTYSNDTWSQISQGNAGYSNPSGWPRQSFASGGTQEYALWSRSSPNDYRTSISKFTYATDTGVMNIPGATYPNTEQTLQVGNSNSTHWYMARGNTPSGPFQSKISKFTFSTDTWEFSTLTDTTYDYGSSTGSGAINNGMTAGYWAGGHGDQQDATSTMKLSYSSGTVSKGPNIPTGRYNPSMAGSGGGNMFTGTSIREWGAETTKVSNLI